MAVSENSVEFFFSISRELKKRFEILENSIYFYENRENSWEIRKIVEICSLLIKSEKYANFFEKFEKIFQVILKWGKILTKLHIIQEKFYEISENSGNFLGNLRICEICLLR